MTKVLTVRIDQALLEKAEAKATMLGVDRNKYVESLIEGDLAPASDRKNSGFVSTDLAGIYGDESPPSATNEEARKRMSKRR